MESFLAPLDFFQESKCTFFSEAPEKQIGLWYFVTPGQNPLRLPTNICKLVDQIFAKSSGLGNLFGSSNVLRYNKGSKSGNGI